MNCGTALLNTLFIGRAKKNFVLWIMLFLSAAAAAQGDKYEGVYVCTKGKAHFFSGATIENIEATSNSTLCVLNVQTKKVYAKMQQASFIFKDKLMQEHFNENYMETEKYPSAVLDMVIANDIDFSKDGAYDVSLKGTLEMHGVKQNREIAGKIIVKNGQPVNGTAVFDVKLTDHKIKVPSVVGANIAESVKVDVSFDFEKYKK
jgi:polyisoprenoid-binding protein YceI